MKVRKLGHKVRMGDGPQAIACTSLTSTGASGTGWWDFAPSC